MNEILVKVSIIGATATLIPWVDMEGVSQDGYIVRILYHIILLAMDLL